MDLSTTFLFIDILDNIHCIAEIILLITIILFVALCFICVIERNDEDDNEDNNKKYFKRLSFYFVISLLFSVIIPNKPTMYMMCATKYMSQSDIPDKVLKILNDKLDEVISKEKNKGDKK